MMRQMHQLIWVPWGMQCCRSCLFAGPTSSAAASPGAGTLCRCLATLAARMSLTRRLRPAPQQTHALSRLPCRLTLSLQQPPLPARAKCSRECLPRVAASCRGGGLPAPSQPGPAKSLQHPTRPSSHRQPAALTSHSSHQQGHNSQRGSSMPPKQRTSQPESGVSSGSSGAYAGSGLSQPLTAWRADGMARFSSTQGSSALLHWLLRLWTHR
jgi:hypothetical protein